MNHDSITKPKITTTFWPTSIALSNSLSDRIDVTKEYNYKLSEPKLVFGIYAIVFATF
ncbi:MAG: hypothetical protein WBF33_20670 [Candidatus Nitrosopolaris sp.]